MHSRTREWFNFYEGFPGMSSPERSLAFSRPQPQKLFLHPMDRKPRANTLAALRFGFWGLGLVLAAIQAWTFRYQVTADSISYLDMSDGVYPGADWHRLINGVWSPLYPLMLGGFRRVFNISPAHEIVVGHLLNLIFFVFAFLCFEFFLSELLKKLSSAARLSRRLTGFQWGGCLVLAYALFLWASLSGISLQYLRPDMLMSGFVYIAVGLLLKIHGNPVRWKHHLALGVVLGLGVLAKEVMLPIGLVIVFTALLIVENWRPALEVTAATVAIMLSIAALYFVPLSIARRSFTLGESGRYNYLLHVDGINPRWYPIHQGTARGAFVRRPEQIFSSPPAYAFQGRALVTHPLRFDPSEWVEGLQPHFDLKSELTASIPNLRILEKLQVQLFPVAIAAAALVFVCRRRLRFSQLPDAWTLWVVGLIGCAIYVPVHIEPRYVTEFIVLFWIGVFAVLWESLGPENNSAWMIPAVAGILLLLPVAAQSWRDYAEFAKAKNQDANAAAELGKLGVRPGDRVARLSASAVDLGVERIARVEIAAEVDRSRANEFWEQSLDRENALLNVLASRGIKAVIATIDDPHVAGRPGWIHLGSTQYWVWLASSDPMNGGDSQLDRAPGSATIATACCSNPAYSQSR